MTATQLSDRVGASPSVTSWHLRHLASFGLVADAEDPGGGTDRRRRWWRAVARGIRFEIPDGGEGQEAARLLRSQMMAQVIGYVGRWLTEVEPNLDDQWSKAAGSGNTGLVLTTAEARRLERDIERLLEPYVTREEPDVLKSARAVRMLRFLLPEATGTDTDTEADPR
jgi:DNA-binding transcriptional ArsR family regulator